jgi:acyl-CoA thioester hydrolase
MGVAHHAAYIPWLEIGRTELLRASGVSYADLERHGIFLVITKLDMKYRRPILYDDLVEVRTRWIGGSRVKIEHTYELFIAERAGKPLDLASAIPIALGSTTLACVNREGRPQPLPDWLTPQEAP